MQGRNFDMQGALSEIATTQRTQKERYWQSQVMRVSVPDAGGGGASGQCGYSSTLAAWACLSTSTN